MSLYLPSYEKSDPKNYILALKESRSQFSIKDPGQMALRSGTHYKGDTILLKALGHEFSVKHPQGIVKFSREQGLEPHFSLQLIFINYLSRADGEPLTYQFIPYREFPGGDTFNAAFFQSAIQPLAQVFGQNLHNLKVLSSKLGGNVIETACRTEIIFWFLPRVPLKYIVWPGDEEINSQANILFDSSAGGYLHTEDLAAAGAYLTELLVDKAENLTLHEII
ncbi:DUF3786 domain-containing protein [Candidatus Contubernalis alkaliaceticus]|uniref:DUF3786 domain-containing protein n=1 Tax=Candidatus Contubernalis alkaliaceticus TaxID=338645 RepID=UPI001F4C0120|nr:DUF3786 domain-containing protein [Candidatus Contubernalis alkalaceticus]UNC90669.1 DUF3786 domain-containing protein [Candidatus Contubernalis alkalaceticus]